MKIRRVEANNHKRAFEVSIGSGVLPFPYFKGHPAPSREDPVEEVFVDPELDREAFTYRLASGAEGTLHVDAVLEYNEDPTYMADLALYRLTSEARKGFEESPLSAREVARRLGTSTTQLYRLLDPANPSKSARQVLSLLYVLGYEVDLELREGVAGGEAG